MTSCPPCPIADSLYPDRSIVWKSPEQRGELPSSEDLWHQEAPTAFSFLSTKEDALLTMSSLRRIAEVSSTQPGLMISFSSDYCNDVGPLLILSIMKESQKAEFRLGHGPDTPWRRVMSALGILEEEVISESSNGDIGLWPLPIERRDKSESDDDIICSEQFACDKLCRKIDEWLNTKSMTLTRKGLVDVTKVFTELFDNAVAHAIPQTSDPDGNWFVGAFMGRRPRKGEDGFEFRCHIAFMSLGASFSQSLDASAGMVRKMRDKYRASCALEGCTENDHERLDTVFAMQDSVSRTDRGGNGLIDMLDIIRELGDTRRVAEHEHPKVAIVSGSTCVHIGREELDMISVSNNAEGRKLWLNQANSSDMPPDYHNVFNITPHFPGVMITLSFQIDDITASITP